MKEIVATFLDAMVYREGVVAVPSDPDNPLASFNNVLVLRSLEDNIEKRLEMQVWLRGCAARVHPAMVSTGLFPAPPGRQPISTVGILVSLLESD